MKTQAGWPVNELGEIVVSNGVGTSNIVGIVAEDYLPVTDNGIIKFAGNSGLVTTIGNAVYVAPFSASGFLFNGGNITVPMDGVWFVGVEPWSSQVRVLPRLGHTGWIPLAKITVSKGKILVNSNIPPVLSPSRIPRVMEKLRKGLSINVAIMGSSLTDSNASALLWPGAVFGDGSVDKYKVPNSLASYHGVGGTPNQYQLAQVGQGGGVIGSGDAGGGATTSRVTFRQGLPNSRSQILDGVDLVVIGCLANGGDYRLETIEPLIRKILELGCEIIVATDNPYAPSLVYSKMERSDLYKDGPFLMSIAELYSVEVADTAAYVFEAYFRNNGIGIYADTIHQQNGVMAGPMQEKVNNGHEAWARAVRSTVPLSVNNIPTTISNYPYTFNEVTPDLLPSSSTLSTVNGSLIVTKNIAGTGSWGLTVSLPILLLAGDSVSITTTITYNGNAPQIGFQTYGWASSVILAPSSGTSGTGTVNITSSTDTLLINSTDPSTLFGGFMVIESLLLSVTSQGRTVFYDVSPNPVVKSRSLPSIRNVTDFKTPSDAYITLPHDCPYVTGGNVNKGTLQASPRGAASFARKFNKSTDVTKDNLVLTAGKKTSFFAPCMVGAAIVSMRVAGEVCQIRVNRNGASLKVIDIPAMTYDTEVFTSIFTPTEVAVSDAIGSDGFEIEVISGTLRIAAFVGLTSDISFLQSSQIEFVGSWLPSEVSRSGLFGSPTDTLGSYATVPCSGKRVIWVISSNPGSKQVNYYSGWYASTLQSTVGNYNYKHVGGLLGPNSKHTIRCSEANLSGSQSNGHALHVGGAIIVNDR